ncbi:MAG: hypothetical protein L3K02_09420, partial [Thermoplasmata archaeon]|nr:hypothetical protein [Thermoplasmata archaeon]
MGEEIHAEAEEGAPAAEKTLGLLSGALFPPALGGASRDPRPTSCDPAHDADFTFKRRRPPERLALHYRSAVAPKIAGRQEANPNR